MHVCVQYVRGVCAGEGYEEVGGVILATIKITAQQEVKIRRQVEQGKLNKMREFG